MNIADAVQDMKDMRDRLIDKQAGLLGHIKELRVQISSADIIIGKASEFLQLIYPADVVTGESGDLGAELVTELRNVIEYYMARYRVEVEKEEDPDEAT